MNSTGHSIVAGGALAGGGVAQDVSGLQMNGSNSTNITTMIFLSSSVSSATPISSATPTMYAQRLTNYVQPLANNLTDFDRTVLNCTGVLPEAEYPPYLDRDDFRDLPEFCSLGCSCVGNSSIPNCRTGPYSQTLFSSITGIAGCGINITDPTPQSLSCSCISPQNASQPNSGIDSVHSLQVPFANGSNPFNVTASYAQRIVAVENRTVSCARPIPQDVSAGDFYNYILAVQLNCLPPSLNIWTARTLLSNGSLPFYRVCDPCLLGYGPDPDCYLQPVPLRGICNDDGSVYRIADTPSLGYKARLYLRNLTFFGDVIVQNNSFFYSNSSSNVTSVPLYSLPPGVPPISDQS